MRPSKYVENYLWLTSQGRSRGQKRDLRNVNYLYHNRKSTNAATIELCPAEQMAPLRRTAHSTANYSEAARRVSPPDYQRAPSHSHSSTNYSEAARQGRGNQTARQKTWHQEPISCVRRRSAPQDVVGPCQIEIETRNYGAANNRFLCLLFWSATTRSSLSIAARSKPERRPRSRTPKLRNVRRRHVLRPTSDVLTSDADRTFAVVSTYFCGRFDVLLRSFVVLLRSFNVLLRSSSYFYGRVFVLLGSFFVLLGSFFRTFGVVYCL